MLYLANRSLKYDAPFIVEIADSIFVVENFTKKMADVKFEKLDDRFKEKAAKLAVVPYSGLELREGAERFGFNTERKFRITMWRSVLSFNSDTGYIRVALVYCNKYSTVYKYDLLEIAVREWFFFLDGMLTLNGNAVARYDSVKRGYSTYGNNTFSHIEQCLPTLDEEGRKQLSALTEHKKHNLLHIQELKEALEEILTSEDHETAILFNDEQKIAQYDAIEKLADMCPWQLEVDKWGNNFVATTGNMQNNLWTSTFIVPDSIIDLRKMNGLCITRDDSYSILYTHLDEFLNRRAEQFGSLLEAWNQTFWVPFIFSLKQVSLSTSLYETSINTLSKLIDNLGEQFIKEISSFDTYESLVTGATMKDYNQIDDKVPIFLLRYSDFQKNGANLLKQLANIKYNVSNREEDSGNTWIIGFTRYSLTIDILVDLEDPNKDISLYLLGDIHILRLGIEFEQVKEGLRARLTYRFLSCTGYNECFDRYKKAGSIETSNIDNIVQEIEADRAVYLDRFNNRSTFYWGEESELLYGGNKT